MAWPVIYKQYLCTNSQQTKEFKKFQAKKLVKSNKSKNFFSFTTFLVVLNFFPSSKIDFWPILKLQKMEFGQNKISWN